MPSTLLTAIVLGGMVTTALPSTALADTAPICISSPGGHLDCAPICSEELGPACACTPPWSSPVRSTLALSEATVPADWQTFLADLELFRLSRPDIVLDALALGSLKPTRASRRTTAVAIRGPAPGEVEPIRLVETPIGEGQLTYHRVKLPRRDFSYEIAPAHAPPRLAAAPTAPVHKS